MPSVLKRIHVADMSLPRRSEANLKHFEANVQGLLFLIFTFSSLFPFFFCLFIFHPFTLFSVFIAIQNIIKGLLRKCRCVSLYIITVIGLTKYSINMPSWIFSWELFTYYHPFHSYFSYDHIFIKALLPYRWLYLLEQEEIEHINSIFIIIYTWSKTRIYAERSE